MPLPIIFIHKGYSSYLEFALRQAACVSKESDIILLGDESNDQFDFIKHVNIKDYFSTAKEFGDIYRHMSNNPYDYELFCFQRWFALKEYMERENIEEIFVCDSDVLWYSNINAVKETGFKDYDCAFMILNGGKQASVGIAYWKLEILSAFCDSLTDEYHDENELQKHLDFYKSLKIGGISDMTLAQKFYTSNKEKLRIYNLLEVKDNAVFDSNINLDYVCLMEKYEFEFGSKKLSWKDGIPYCKNLGLDTIVKFHLIHFQGPAKYMMSKCYTGNKFNGQLVLSAKYAVLNCMAFWYKILNIRTRFAFLWRN